VGTHLYLQRIAAGAPNFVGGTDFPPSQDVCDRAIRVLIHARC
jgi:hypothetical protein